MSIGINRWIVKDSDDNIVCHLVGTMHLLLRYNNKSLKELDKLIDDSKHTFVEISLEKSQGYINEKITEMIDRSGGYIKYYDKKLIDMLRDEGDVQRLGLLGSLPPKVVLGVSLVSHKDVSEIYNKNMGNPLTSVIIDSYVAERAKSKLLELETKEYQFDMLYSLYPSDEVAAKELERVFLDTSARKLVINSTKALFKAYKGLKPKILEDDIKHAYPKMSNYAKEAHTKMIVDRNRIMLNGFLPHLNKERPIVVAVGILHLIDSVVDSGIIKSLEKMGYKVEYRPL